MPIELVEDLVRRKLGNIGYVKNTHTSPSCSLRDKIIGGMGLDVSVDTKNKLDCILSDYDFFSALRYDYIGYKNRIDRQSVAILQLLDNKKVPSAWILVTAYYSAFYSSIQICRLLGKYTMNFVDEDIRQINNVNSSTVRLTEKGVYVSDGIDIRHNGDIHISFIKSGQKPHDKIWQNLSDSITDNVVSKISNPNRLSRIELFRKIISKNKRDWPLPNELRNDWNYKITNSYDSSHDKIASNFVGMLKDPSCKRVMTWSKSKLRPHQEDIISTMAFIQKCLKNTIVNISPMLI